MINLNGKFDTTLNSPHHQRIKIQEDDYLDIYGYEKSKSRTFFTWTGYIFTVGLLRVVFHWMPQWHLHALNRPCSLQNASKILVEETYEDKYKIYMVVKVEDLIKNNNELNENVIPPKGQDETFELYVEDGELIEISHFKLIHVKKITFIWHENLFKRLRGLDCGPSKEELASSTGYDSSSHVLRERVFGPNLIQCRVQSFGQLLLLECLNPLYFFQLFTLGVWIAEKYFYYCIAIVIMSVYGIASSIIQTRRNQKSLHATVTSTEVYSVWRESEGWKDESSDTLIPGDVVRIPKSGANLTFDGVLLNGNCIVNESMLTGESVPVTKTPILKLSSMYNVKEDSNHTLFSGTKVIQTRSFDGEEVRCVVIRTGYDTAKGELVRYILYPKKIKSQMDRDPYRGMLGLGIIAAIGCLYTIIDKVSRGVEGTAVAIFTLDIITIVIPAALPAAITMGKMYAQARLSRNGIYCINSHSINVAGSIDCICFDKTGTLTEDGLDMWGCIPIIGSPRIWSIPYQNIIEMQAKITDDIRRLTTIMASCHSLTYIDNEFLGDPLDVKMFESTGWILEEPNIDDNSKFDLLVSSIIKDPKNPTFEIGTVRQNQFNSTLQRMSVVVRTFGLDHFEVFCKGSPEKLISLCRPESVPENTKEILKKYTSKGYRVIAAAVRELPQEINYVKMQRMTREELETDLSLCGLIILENRLKSATQPVIQELIEAKMKVYMLTGDNIETALSVARQCGILGPNEPVAQVEIDYDGNNKSDPILKFRKSSLTEMMPEMKIFGRNDLENGPELPFDTALAMTGTSWKLLNQYFPLLVSAILERTVVMGRLSSDQKQQVVIQLQALDYHVAMCGDGANDCGALKSAHIGVSLSDQESSVASPFTSKIADISSVIKVIREGRAALITSFGVFRFMVCYSLTEFFSVSILYSIDSNLTDLQFLFVDIILVVNFLFFFGKTKSYKGSLYPKTPISRLLSLPPLMSIVSQSLLTITLQILVFYVITLYPWFVPYVRKRGSYSCHQNYAVWAISTFQYISQVVAFSRGSPYRKPIYTNGYFMFSLIITTCLCIYLVTYPSNLVLGILDYVLPPSYNFIILILSLGVIHFIISITMERFLEYWLEKRNARLKEEKQNMVRKSQSELLSRPYNTSFGFINYNFVSDSKV